MTPDPIERLRRETERLRARVARLQEIVDKQAQDDGLWFIAQTAPEAYLQQELRKLHAAIEQEIEL